MRSQTDITVNFSSAYDIPPEVALELLTVNGSSVYEENSYPTFCIWSPIKVTTTSVTFGITNEHVSQTSREYTGNIWVMKK